MSCIADYLALVPSDRIALQRVASLTYGDLATQAGNRPPQLRDRGVAVYASRLSLAVTALAQLDGWAAHLFLASRGTPLAEVLTLAQRAECDILLSDDPPEGELPPAMRCLPLPLACEQQQPSENSVESAAAVPTTWLLATSGTTGKPKLVGHCLASLTRTAKLDPERSSGVRWGLLYDYARFAGLQVVLQTLLSGATLIAPDPSAALDRQVDELATGGCTHLSATPTLWRKLLMTAGADRLALRQITLGGEIADQRLLTALGAKFPTARIAHIYASTEAGVGFSVSDGLAGFPAGFLAKPRGGVELRVRQGQLSVRNTTVQGTYIDGQRFADAEGFVDTGDLVEQRGDRYFFLGRASGVINVGGNKVHPEEVERVLLEHPSVAQARVSARNNPITGNLVIADVVTNDGAGDRSALRDSILQHCRARLQRFQVPVALRIVEELALNASGKILRGPV